MLRILGRKEIKEAVVTAALVSAVTWLVNKGLEKLEKMKEEKMKERKKRKDSSRQKRGSGK